MTLDGLRVCMFVLNALDRDPRVWREAEALAAAGAGVEIFMLRGEGQPARSEPGARISVIRLSSPAPLSRKPWTAARRYLPIYRAVGKERRDVYHCHDGAALPLGVALARRDHARLVYDAHEYFPDHAPADSAESFVNRLRRRLMPDYLWEMMFIRRADLRITVTEEMARLLTRRYRLADPPKVVSNMAPYWEPTPEDRTRLRNELGVAPDVPIIVFLGSARESTYAYQGDKDRGIETLVDALAFLPEAHLAIIGAAGDEYEEAVLQRARKHGLSSRIHFLGLQPYSEYLALASGGDAGVYLTGARKQSTTRTSSLPNRLFDFIMARLPLVVGSETEAAKIVSGRGVGVVVDTLDPQVVAGAIQKAMDEARAFGSRLQADVEQAAKDLCWEKESLRLLEAYSGLGDPARS